MTSPATAVSTPARCLVPGVPRRRRAAAPLRQLDMLDVLDVDQEDADVADAVLF
jgi:hypothetical protein